MNKKVNTSKVTQSELSQIHAHCKKNHLGDLKVWGLLLLPSLIIQYWYYDQSSSIRKPNIVIFIFIILILFLHNTLNEFGFPALSWSNFLQLIYLCIYPHTFITISYRFIIFQENSIIWDEGDSQIMRMKI